ncbi:NUDIX domain-containing protein [Candidatus Nanosalina sp. VS9-1]|uniref:NUDIX domain-containing protein n=1 Tax=Candidatus Nanosalina sp. VS9-1 TaxID=3388566 RepID=UPI0039E0D61C
MKDKIDVVQTVVKTPDERYLIGLRSKDGYWEFLGGKVEEGENLEEAAIRELNEETDLGLSEDEIQSFEVGESYRSSDDRKYVLNPVLIEIGKKKASKLSQDDLSREHEDFEWIDLHDFYEYETLGQYRALENLGIVNGDVALTVPEDDEKFLILKRSEKTSSSGLWNFPGGKIENEEKEDAAIRELQEETGLKGEIVEEGECYISSGELGYWRIFPFLVEASGEVFLSEEHSEFQWSKIPELRDLDALGNLRSLESLGVIEDE